MGDNVVILKTWKEHQKEEKTWMVLKWFLWLVGIGIITFIVFSTGLFSFQTSLIIGIISFIILFILFILRKQVWAGLKKLFISYRKGNNYSKFTQPKKSKKGIILIILIIALIIGSLLIYYVIKSQLPIPAKQNIPPKQDIPPIPSNPQITTTPEQNNSLSQQSSVPIAPEVKSLVVEGSRDSIIITNNQQNSVSINVTYRIYSKWYGADYQANNVFDVGANISKTFYVYNNDGCSKGIGDCSVSIINYNEL